MITQPSLRAEFEALCRHVEKAKAYRYEDDITDLEQVEFALSRLGEWALQYETTIAAALPADTAPLPDDGRSRTDSDGD